MIIRALIPDFGGTVTRTLFETQDLTEAALGLAPGTLTDIPTAQFDVTAPTASPAEALAPLGVQPKVPFHA